MEQESNDATGVEFEMWLMKFILKKIKSTETTTSYIYSYPKIRDPEAAFLEVTGR